MERAEPVTTQSAPVTSQPKAEVVKKSSAASTTSKSKSVQKTYATKDPAQKATPGPIRQAAPQLPVIQ